MVFSCCEQNPHTLHFALVAPGHPLYLRFPRLWIGSESTLEPGKSLTARVIRSQLGGQIKAQDNKATTLDRSWGHNANKATFH